LNKKSKNAFLIKIRVDILLYQLVNILSSAGQPYVLYFVMEFDCFIVFLKMDNNRCQYYSIYPYTHPRMSLLHRITARQLAGAVFVPRTFRFRGRCYAHHSQRGRFVVLSHVTRLLHIPIIRIRVYGCKHLTTSIKILYDRRAWRTVLVQNSVCNQRILL